MNEPLVSIIIPIFNAEKYIEATIQSAARQTWAKKEIILVDDGSTDNSLSIAKKHEGDWIKVYSQKNSGAAAARNRGLTMAKGDFVQFLDADDLLARNKLSRQLSLIGNRNDMVATCPVVHFTNDQENNLSGLCANPHELKFYGDSDDPFEFLLKLYGINNNSGSMIPVHSWLTPTEVIKKAGHWNEELSMNDDGEFFCRVAINAAKIVNATDTYCYYRKIAGESSLSSSRNSKSLSSQFKSIQLIKRHLENHSADPRIIVVFKRMLMELVVQAYPQHRQLVLAIERQIVEAGGTITTPIIGGRGIEYAKKIFGWKFARVLQYYYQKR